MSWFDVLAGVASIAGLALAVYFYFDNVRTKHQETVKLADLRTRIETAFTSSAALLSAIDRIVQVPKERTPTIKELQDHARTARDIAYALRQQLDSQKRTVENWRYGGELTPDRGSDVPSQNATGAV